MLVYFFLVSFHSSVCRGRFLYETCFSCTLIDLCDGYVTIVSMVVKGIVCKKNVAHRRMTSKIEKPRILILGGALEYQRISNALSSLDTLLQQVDINPFSFFL